MNSQAKIKANNKYEKKTYDFYGLHVKKEFSTKIKESLTQRNESANSFFNRAAVTQMAVDNGEITAELAIIIERVGDI